MPWTLSGVVERRKQFVAEYRSGDWTMMDLCQAYGISRPTGYEVLRRYERNGELGLEEQSRAPQRHPNQTPAEIEEPVLALRRQHARCLTRHRRKRRQTEPYRRPRWPPAKPPGDGDPPDAPSACAAPRVKRKIELCRVTATPVTTRTVSGCPRQDRSSV